MDRLESMKIINKPKDALKMRGAVTKINLDNIFRNNLFATYQTLEHNGLYSPHFPSQQTSGLTPNIQAMGIIPSRSRLHTIPWRNKNLWPTAPKMRIFQQIMETMEHMDKPTQHKG